MSPTEDYFSFYAQLLDYAPHTILSLFFLGMTRLAPLLVVAPFFGSKLASPVKMGLLISLAVVFLPHIVLTSKTMVEFDMIYIALFFKELLIGIILGMFSAIPFYIAESSGIFIDFIRGSSSLQVTDPSTQSQSSSIGMFYNSVMIVIFYQLNGPLLFFDAIFTSFTIVPADGWINPSFFSAHNPIWPFIMGIIARIFAVGIQLAAPSLLAILMTELFLGIANRLAPQVQIVFLGMSLKSLAGLALLCIAWFFILQQMGKQSLLWIKDVNQFLPSFGR